MTLLILVSGTCRCTYGAPRWTSSSSVSGSTTTNRTIRSKSGSVMCVVANTSRFPQLASGPLADGDSPFVVSSPIAV